MSNLRILRITIFVIAGVILLKATAIFLSNRQKENDKPWSNKYTSDIYKSIYDGFGVVISDGDKSSLANCVVEKLIKDYPNGIESIPKGSMGNAILKYTRDCRKGLHLHFSWSTRTDSLIKGNLLRRPVVMEMKEKYRTSFCDCYLNKIKEHFPNGFVDSVRQSTQDSVFVYCTDLVKKQ